MALIAFADKWDDQFPMIGQIWQRHWENATPFLDYPPEVRKLFIRPMRLDH
jgi:putative transposase